MASTRVVTLVPNGTTKTDFGLQGAASHQAALSDSSDTSYIESTTNGNIDRLTLGTALLAGGEFVSMVKVRVRAATQANHTIDVAVGLMGAGFSALGGQSYRIPASQAIQQFTTMAFAGAGDPASSDSTLRGKLDQTKVDNLVVQLTLNEGAAQAATSKVYKVEVDLYISKGLPKVVRSGPRLKFSDGRQARLYGMNLGPLDHRTLAQWETVLQAHKDAGFNTVRIWASTAQIKTAAGIGSWIDSELGKLVELMSWMHDNDLYLDLTLNAAFDAVDNPSWLESLTEAQRWDERRIVARKLGGMLVDHPVKAYICLINEGVAPTSNATGWRYGDNGSHNLDGLFGEHIVKAPAGRAQNTIWGTWLADILSATDGVRLVDPDGLYGCGMHGGMEIPGGRATYIGGLKPGDALFAGLDLLLPHVYPGDDGTRQVEYEFMRELGMPIVHEEFSFSLTEPGGTAAESAYFDYTRSSSSGYLGQSDGRTSAQYVPPLTLPEQLFLVGQQWYDDHVYWSLAPVLEVTIDPSLTGGAALELNGDNNGYLVLLDPPPNFDPPSLKAVYASSFDTEGDVPVGAAHYNLRDITFTVRVTGADDEDLGHKLDQIYRKIGKVQREGGELQVTQPSGFTRIYDLVPESWVGAPQPSIQMLRQHRTDVEFRLKAHPLWREQEELVNTFSEQDEPILQAVIPGSDGHVSDLGRLLLLNYSTENVWRTQIGRQSRYYDPADTAALYYQAADMGLRGGAVIAGFGAQNANLTPYPVVMLVSALGGVDLTHKGSYRLWMRHARTAFGRVTIQAEIGEPASNRYAVNAPASYEPGDREGKLISTDLGAVYIDPSWDSWEFRILVTSTNPGDSITLYDFQLVPADEGITDLSAVQRQATASGLFGYDEYEGAGVAADLHGRTAPTGGNWDANDGAGTFRIREIGPWVTRDDDGDTALEGAFAILGSTVYEGVVTAMAYSGGNAATGVLFAEKQLLIQRYVDPDNWFGGGVVYDHLGQATYLIVKMVAGVQTTVRIGINPGDPFIPFKGLTAFGNHRMYLRTELSGLWYMWFDPPTGAAPDIQGFDPDLVSGGGLDAGKVGYYDEMSGVPTAPVTRHYDNFYVTLLPTDAAIFAGRYMEVTHEGARRQTSDGSKWAEVSQRRGTWFTIPPAGLQGRQTRIGVRVFPQDPDVGIDTSIDIPGAIAMAVYRSKRGL